MGYTSPIKESTPTKKYKLEDLHRILNDKSETVDYKSVFNRAIEISKALDITKDEVWASESKRYGSIKTARDAINEIWAEKDKILTFLNEYNEKYQDSLSKTLKSNLEEALESLNIDLIRSIKSEINDLLKNEKEVYLNKKIQEYRDLEFNKYKSIESDLNNPQKSFKDFKVYVDSLIEKLNYLTYNIKKHQNIKGETFNKQFKKDIDESSIKFDKFKTNVDLFVEENLKLIAKSISEYKNDYLKVQMPKLLGVYVASKKGKNIVLKEGDPYALKIKNGLDSLLVTLEDFKMLVTQNISEASNLVVFKQSYLNEKQDIIKNLGINSKIFNESLNNNAVSGDDFKKTVNTEIDKWQKALRARKQKYFDGKKNIITFLSIDQNIFDKSLNSNEVSEDAFKKTVNTEIDKEQKKLFKIKQSYLNEKRIIIKSLGINPKTFNESLNNSAVSEDDFRKIVDTEIDKGEKKLHESKQNYFNNKEIILNNGKSIKISEFNFLGGDEDIGSNIQKSLISGINNVMIDLNKFKAQVDSSVEKLIDERRHRKSKILSDARKTLNINNVKIGTFDKSWDELTKNDIEPVAYYLKKSNSNLRKLINDQDEFDKLKEEFKSILPMIQRLDPKTGNIFTMKAQQIFEKVDSSNDNYDINKDLKDIIEEAEEFIDAQ